MSLSLCAKLNALHRGWMDWKETWHALPTPRLLGGPYTPPSTGHGWSLYEWHPVALRQHPASRPDYRRKPAPKGDRFFAGGPSQMFETLFGALRKARDDKASALNRDHRTAGRRLFLFLGTRGVGKGHFFEALRAPKRLEEFLSASWPGGETPRYDAVLMINLSFSTEVMSAFDRLCNVLDFCAKRVFAGKPEAANSIHKASSSLSRDRIGRLIRVLELYDEFHREASGRVLVAINAFHVLFNQGGQPKNGQAARLLEALLSRRSARAPIDLLLVCSGRGFPKMFRQTNEDDPESFCAVDPIALEHLVRPGISERGRRTLAATVAEHGVLIDSGPTVSGRQRRKVAFRFDELAEKPAAFFHVLHRARASLIITAYFPLTALALAMNPGCLTQRRTPRVDPIMVPGFEDRRRVHQTVMERVERWTADQKSADKLSAPTIRQTIPRLMICLAHYANSNDCSIENRNKYISSKFEAWFNKDKINDKKPEEYLDSDFRHLFDLFSHSRLALSLACCAATEAAWNQDGDGGAFQSARVVGWFQDAARQLLGTPPQPRVEQTIGYVLKFYRTRHDAAMPLPAHCGIKTALEKSVGAEGPNEGYVALLEKRLRGPGGWELQQLLLWHLGVCNHPVEADVLAAAPKIEEALDRFKPDGKNAPGPKAWECHGIAVVKAALDLLVHRCLVFRLRPAVVDSADAFVIVKGQEKIEGTDPTTTADTEGAWRYGLHRLVQRSIYLQLHAPSVEFPDVDAYSLSIYGTLPNDLPRPRAEAVADLEKLVSTWTGFPNSVATINQPNAYHKAQEKAREAREKAGNSKPARLPRGGDPAAREARTLPSRMLRAAYGVIRSVYSVGVVSRFNDFTDRTGPPVPTLGYMEQHRLQIRWLIKEAVDMSGYATARGADGAGESAPVRAKDGAAPDHIPPVHSGENHREETRRSDPMPFYAEEIVWLYNECGLLSLIEGRLNDANALFDRALAAAARIEPEAERSPLRTRVRLNKAVVDLERGRIAAARHQLGLIAQRTDEHPAIRLIADGYIGVCAHVNGDFATAKARYDTVIDALRRRGDARGVAIFSRHLADLHRASGAAGAADAYQAIDQSIAHAQRSGHEDVRQLARLARVRVDISQLSTTLRADSIQKDLDDIERYAEVMGMPRLICEVAFARATFLLAIGETRHATTLASRCLQVATMCDLKLRQVSGLALLARIYEKRGHAVAAGALFTLAQTFANLCDYRSAAFMISDHRGVVT